MNYKIIGITFLIFGIYCYIVIKKNKENGMSIKNILYYYFFFELFVAVLIARDLNP